MSKKLTNREHIVFWNFLCWEAELSIPTNFIFDMKSFLYIRLYPISIEAVQDRIFMSKPDIMLVIDSYLVMKCQLLKYKVLNVLLSNGLRMKNMPRIQWIWKMLNVVTQLWAKVPVRFQFKNLVVNCLKTFDINHTWSDDKVKWIIEMTFTNNEYDRQRAVYDNWQLID